MELSNGQLAAAELPEFPFAGAHLPVRRVGAGWCCKPWLFGPHGLTGGLLDRQLAGIKRTSEVEAQDLGALLPAGLATRLLDRQARAVAPAIDQKLVLLPRHQ